MKTFKLLCGFIFCIILIAMNSCQDKQTKDELAKFKQAETLKANNIELAKKFYKHLDAVQLDSMRLLCAPDIKIYYESGDPVSFSDIEPLVRMFYTSFPDYKHEFDEIFATDDKVVFRISHENASFQMKILNPYVIYKGLRIELTQLTNLPPPLFVKEG